MKNDAKTNAAAHAHDDLRELRGDALKKELVGRARELVPLLAKNATKTEEDRRVVEENITAIQDAGLFRIMVPRRFGGLETDLRTKLEVSRELARGCGSTAWVTTLLNVCSWFVGTSSDEEQRDVWGTDPDARVAGVLAPSCVSKYAEGGQIVTGKWAWASGSAHAQWGLVGLPVVDKSGQPIDQGLAVVPMKDLTIEDTWFVAGMKGTASNTLVASEVFIPNHRILSIPKALGLEHATPHKGEALYRSAFVPVAVLVLAGPQLGLASAALDYVIAKAPKRAVSYTFYEKSHEAPTVQLAIAEAAMQIDTAHLHAYRAAEDIDSAARENRELSYTERARIRMDTGYAVRHAREAIRMLVTAHGAGSFADSSPMQRIWRDSEVASRHAVISPDISAEVYGRALLGITEGVTALV